MPANLTLVIIALIFLAVSGGRDGLFIGLGGFFYLIMLIETACSRTMKFLNHIDSADEV